MKFIPDRPVVAEAFIEGFLAPFADETCLPVLRIGPMGAIHPVGQRLLKACAERGIRIELIT